MSTRNVLDSLGNVIGSLTLADETSENDWAAALAPYALANVPQPSSGLALKTYNKTGAGNVTTSSGTAALVGGMSETPVPGTYLISFSGSIYTDGASAQGEFGIYIDGILLAETRRDIKCNLSLLGGLVSISLNAIGVGTYTSSEILLNGSQLVEVKFKSSNGGVIGFGERVMNLMKVR